MQVNCCVPDCPKPVFRFGMCRMHYDRCVRYGGPGPAGMIGKRAPLDERFINNVQTSGPTPAHAPHLGPCSLWTGYVHGSGYGAIRSGHRLIYVHRYAYEQAHGPIPAGCRVEQICRNKLCVRDDHLVLRP
jgi:hypothetical protein